MKLKWLCFFILFLAVASFPGVNTLSAAETLPGGTLGATKEEIRAKLGMPTFYYIEEHHSRRHWLFPVEDVDNVKSMLWANPDVPIDDVIPVTRDGEKLMYRVHYEWDGSQEAQRVLRATKCWVFFEGKSVALGDVPRLVSEFGIAVKPGVSAYEQRDVTTGKVVVTFLVPGSSGLARALSSGFRPPSDDYEWSPSFEVVLSEGESENISLQSKVSEVIITVGSQTRIQKLARVFGIKDIANPFSS